MAIPSISNILLSYDQALIAEGIQAVLSGFKTMRIVGKLPNRRDLPASVASFKADLLIVELCEITDQRFFYLKRMKELNPKLKILVISGPVPRKVLDVLMHVINGFLIRNCSSEKVIQAIQELNETGKYLCPKSIQILFEEDSSKNLFDVSLTVREKEILALWLTTKDNREISERLNICCTTVRTHLKNIRDKFGPVNQLEMLVYACRENLLNDQFKPICPNCRSFCFPIVN